MRSLQDAKQYGCPDRTDRRNLAKLFPGLVFLGLCQQLPPHLLTHRPQRIEYVTCTSPRSPSINCRIMLAFVSMTHSIPIFPAPFITAIEMLSLCTSIPIYFLLSIEGVPFRRD